MTIFEENSHTDWSVGDPAKTPATPWLNDRILANYETELVQADALDVTR